MEGTACEFAMNRIRSFFLQEKNVLCYLPVYVKHVNLFGFFRYHEMADWLGRPFRSVPRHHVSPLKVSISRKLKEVVEEKYKKAGAERGKYVVIHGIKSDSKASMQSKGDPDSLLPIEVWAEITRDLRYLIFQNLIQMNLFVDF